LSTAAWGECKEEKSIDKPLSFVPKGEKLDSLSTVVLKNLI
jgi:hypothetical protein